MAFRVKNGNSITGRFKEVELHKLLLTTGQEIFQKATKLWWRETVYDYSVIKTEHQCFNLYILKRLLINFFFKNY